MLDLLVVVPHPDDEVFGAGGLLVLAKRDGLRTGVLTLTRGEAGRTLGLCTKEELPQRRVEELRRSAEILGVDRLEVLSFPNGLPQDRDDLPRGPFSGRSLLDHPEAEEAIRERVLAWRPRYLVTFPPDGINGHPDHVACSRYATRAASGLARLFYYAPPQGGLPITHRLRLPEEALARKLRAIAQYKTQALSVLAFMERAPERLWTETFHEVGKEGVWEGKWW
ncbi:LmbE-like protein [Thermus filiformis]|uniref:LmbE-like protein n=1 Tax=Thermus filiformis TaxID=276 RepID=A0A0A2X9Q1_THEFI|nr:LmbE-like protein [Thermus filiformis]